MIAVLNWLVNHWYVIFWLAIFGVFEGIRDFFIDLAKAAGSIGERKHKRRIKELKLQAQIVGEAATASKKPGPCVHRNVTPVISADETVVAWLCKSCEEKLPADWAVREEDL